MKIVAITGMDLTYLIEHVPPDLKGLIEIRTFRKKEEAYDFLPEAEVLVTAGKMNVSILEQMPQLSWVQTLSAGVDKMPLPIFAERGIALTNMSGVHTIQMSEFTLSLMLQWVRRANQLYSNQINHIWDQQIKVGELYGKTVGIIGAGAIGEAVARKAKAFDMHVIGLTRSGAQQSECDELVTGEDGLSYLLQRSDFVVLLLPSTPKTRHFLREEHFAQMKPDALLINLARGEVIVEADLIHALRNKQIAGAALDVFEQEPLPENSPLWNMDNVILTPHIAGSSVHYIERAAAIFFHNIREYLAGRPLHNQVDLNEGY